MTETCIKKSGTQVSGAADSAQPAALLAASIGRLLQDVQSAQLARLRELRLRLQCDAFAWDNALLTHAIEVFLAASRKLDFGLLRRHSVWARLTGAAEAAVRAFRNSYGDVVGAAERAKQEFELLSCDYRAHTSRARKLVVELDLEYRELDREIDQGAEWLVELSYAIETADVPAALSSRAMVHSTQLKRCRRVSALAKEITILGQNVLERRAALLERLKLDLNGFEQIWLQRVAHLGPKAADRNFPLLLLDKGQEVHAELIARLELTRAACMALQVEEQAMARRLAILRDCLDQPG